MHDNLVILAGGASSRMKKPSTTNTITSKETEEANTKSKGLIGLGGRPLMDYLLYNAKLANYKNIYIVVGKQATLFKDYYVNGLGRKTFEDLNIYFAIQHIPSNREKPFGTADALLQAIEQYPELSEQYFSVCNSDNLYSYEALYALRDVNCENAFISYSRDTLEFPLEKIARFALAKLDSENFLTDIIEKPKDSEVDNYRDASGTLRVSMNAFKFSGKMIHPYLKNCPVNKDRDEKELPTALLNMLKDNSKSLKGIPFSEHVPDLTSKDDIAIVKEYLKKNNALYIW